MESKDIVTLLIGLIITLSITTLFLFLNLLEFNEQQKANISIFGTIIITAIGVIFISYKKFKEIDNELEKSKSKFEEIDKTFKTNDRLSNLESVVFHKNKIKKWQ